MATAVDLTSAKNILQQCSFSKLGTKSVEAPFFIPDLEKKEIADDLVNKANGDSMKDNTVILAVGDRVNLPAELLRIYMLLDSNDREFTYHTFTFFPITELKRRLEIFEKSNQLQVCDVAISHHGLGHVVVLSWDRKNNRFFLRMDGGSNGYDRDANWRFISAYDTDETPDSKRIAAEDLFTTISVENVESLSDYIVSRQY